MDFIPLSRVHEILHRSSNRQSLGGVAKVPTLTEFRVMSNQRRAKLARLVMKHAHHAEQFSNKGAK